MHVAAQHSLVKPEGLQPASCDHHAPQMRFQELAPCTHANPSWWFVICSNQDSGVLHYRAFLATAESAAAATGEAASAVGHLDALAEDLPALGAESVAFSNAAAVLLSKRARNKQLQSEPPTCFGDLLTLPVGTTAVAALGREHACGTACSASSCRCGMWLAQAIPQHPGHADAALGSASALRPCMHQAPANPAIMQSCCPMTFCNALWPECRSHLGSTVSRDSTLDRECCLPILQTNRFKP